MREKSYAIPIEPIPWKRAGLSGKKFFDTQSREKISIGLLLANQHGNQPLFDGPLEFIVTFHIHIPEGKHKVIKEGDWQIEKGDYDNYSGFLTDTMKNIVITDDKRICRAIIEKKYSKNPRTEFTIRELK